MTIKKFLDNNLLRKSIVYGADYGARIIENVAKYGTNAVPKGGSTLGHPYAALIYTGIDLFAENNDAIKNSAYYKLAKLGGFLFFAGKAGVKAFNFIKGNYDDLENLPFDLITAGSLGYDLVQPGKDFLKKWDFTFGLKKKKTPSQ